MNMNQFIHVLNYAGLRWSSKYRNNHLDYISINVEEGSEVLFDLETGLIMRIALLDGKLHQNQPYMVVNSKSTGKLLFKHQSK